MQNSQARVGRHVSSAGGICNSLSNATKIGCNTMQIFLSSPQMWRVAGISKDDASAFNKEQKVSGVWPVFVHMPYLPNLASPNADIYKKSVDTLESISVLCDSIAADYVIVHLGSHLGKGKEAGIHNVITAIGTALDASDSVCVLLEDQARQANSVGADIEDVKEIYDGIGSERVGICLDTCHLFAAGYDIRDRSTLEAIDRAIGFRNVKALHLNDAQYGLGSGKDRHAQIGEGFIGTEGFSKFFSYKKTSGIPVITETPVSSDKEAADEIMLVRRLMG
jgi:deoxyribonuclease-4